MNSFTLEYSENGKTYKRINDYTLSDIVIGSVRTIYFVPVYAKTIRLVVKTGKPNIKI